MSIDFIRLIIDFGLVVLIWTVQLVIYPSFLYYQREDLLIWHRKYTSQISLIVIPLMLAQLGFSIVQVTLTSSFLAISSLVLVLLIWILTFWQFVPIHNSISGSIVDTKMLNTLVKKNWIRTILWTAIFLMSIFFQK